MRRSLFQQDLRGASAVEFGLIAGPLLLLILGVMEFGRAIWTREALEQAAIAGARCMAMVQADCGASGSYSASMTTAYIQGQAAK